MKHSSKYSSRNLMITTLLFFLIVFFSSVRPAYHAYDTTDPAEKEKFFRPVIEKLFSRGADTSFILKLIRDSHTNFDEKFVKINVTGYLNKTDYSYIYSEESATNAKRFILQKDTVLTKCENIYHVPKEIITSIIWMESKFGEYLGKSHVPSVFLSTAMATQPEFIELNERELRSKFTGPDSELVKLVEKVRDRARRKSDWAANEMLALEAMYKSKSIPVMDLYGSWAGAIGIPQFLPSSYLRWAVDGNGDGKIDLFNMDDAIFSVANYLKTNGWSDFDTDRRAALFHYNNSNDYVDAVLALASRIENKSIGKPLEKQLRGLNYSPVRD